MVRMHYEFLFLFFIIFCYILRYTEVLPLLPLFLFVFELGVPYMNLTGIYFYFLLDLKHGRR